MITENAKLTETLLYSYTRADAIADGVLVDVTAMAQQAGFRYPVAVTETLWADIAAIPERSGQDVDGRLWDVLSMAWFAIRQSRNGGSILDYTLIMPVGGVCRAGFLDDPASLYPVRLVCGPGDNLEPVITLMQPGED